MEDKTVEIFTPYISSSERVLHSAYLGFIGLPIILNTKHFYCLTDRRLCLFKISPLGSRKYSEILLEDIVTSEINKPSLLFFVVLTSVLVFVPDRTDVRDFFELLNTGIGLLSVIIFLVERMFVAMIILLPFRVVTYFLFLRPTLYIAVYGSHEIAAAIAFHNWEESLRGIIRDIHKLRNGLRRVDLKRRSGAAPKTSVSAQDLATDGK